MALQAFSKFCLLSLSLCISATLIFIPELCLNSPEKPERNAASASTIDRVKINSASFSSLAVNTPRATGTGVFSRNSQQLPQLKASNGSAVSGRGATAEEASRLSLLIQKYVDQNGDNPGAASRELSAVRTEMIRLQMAGVSMTFDIKNIDDAKFKKLIYKSLEREVAGNGTAGWMPHGAMVCLAFILCHFGGPGPIRYPELSVEARRQIESTHGVSR